MDFRVDDADRARPVWDTVIDSLKLDGTSRNRLNIDGSHRAAKLSLNRRASSWGRRGRVVGRNQAPACRPGERMG